MSTTSVLPSSTDARKIPGYALGEGDEPSITLTGGTTTAQAPTATTSTTTTTTTEQTTTLPPSNASTVTAASPTETASTITPPESVTPEVTESDVETDVEEVTEPTAGEGETNVETAPETTGGTSIEAAPSETQEVVAEVTEEQDEQVEEVEATNQEGIEQAQEQADESSEAVATRSESETEDSNLPPLEEWLGTVEEEEEVVSTQSGEGFGGPNVSPDGNGFSPTPISEAEPTQNSVEASSSSNPVNSSYDMGDEENVVSDFEAEETPVMAATSDFSVVGASQPPSGDEYDPEAARAQVQDLTGTLQTAAADAIQQIETHAEEVRASLHTNADALRASVQEQVAANIATQRAAFEAERGTLEVALGAARIQIVTALGARLAEADASGNAAKASLRATYAQHRASVTTIVQEYVAHAEEMRTHYATHVHTRTQASAAEARRRGAAKAASYPTDERGRAQASAARGVAEEAAREIEKREPDTIEAVEELVVDIPDQFREKGQEALEGFDDGLEEQLEKIDEQVQAVKDSLNEEAEQANAQLDELGDQLHGQLDSIEEAAIAHAEALLPQAEAQIQSSLDSALAQLDTSVPQAIDQINQTSEQAAQAMLDIPTPDVAASQEFLNQVLTFMQGIVTKAGEGLVQAGEGMGGTFTEASTATSESLTDLEAQTAEDLATFRETSNTALTDFVAQVDERFGESILQLTQGFTEAQTGIGEELALKVEDLRGEFGTILADAEAKIVEAVDAGLAKNDESLGQLDASMEEAASDAAWDYDHPILSTIRDIGAFILGALAAIVVILIVIVVVIVAFKALVAGLVFLGVSAAVAEFVVAVIGLGMLAYGVYEAYQARVGRGEGGGWGTFGMALLDMTGLTDMYRAFTAPGLSPFERGWLFGEGLVKLVTTVLLVRGAWRFVRGGGLRAAWRGLWRGAGRLARSIGRGLRSVGRGIGRGVRAIGRGIGRGVRGIGRGLRDLGRRIRGRRGRSRRGGCFVAGTKVLTPAGPREIEALSRGDVVISLDPLAGEQTVERIRRTFVRTVPVLLDIYIGSTIITCSPEHPFWAEGDGWRRAGSLMPGDLLLTHDSHRLAVNKVSRREGSFAVFNIEVEGVHTYHVSELGILVHNKAMMLRATPKGRQITGHAAEDSLARHGFREPWADVDAVIDGATRTVEQADGATVHIQSLGGRRYNFVIEGESGIVTGMRNVPAKQMNTFARNYGWEPWP